jgi:hypothetical protein
MPCREVAWLTPKVMPFQVIDLLQVSTGFEPYPFSCGQVRQAVRRLILANQKPLF